jgi:hypothetical protein
LKDNFVIPADTFVKGLNNSLVENTNIENILSVEITWYSKDTILYLSFL